MIKRMGLCCLFFFTQSCIAGSLPGAFTLTVAEGYYHYAGGWHLQDTSIPNWALAYNISEKLGLEASAGVFNTKNTRNERHIHGFLYTIDGIYRFMNGEHWVPYAIGGLGMIAINHNEDSNKHPGNINAGLGTQLFWDSVVAMRAEVRDIFTTTGNSRNDVMINFGISFQFGGKK